MIGREVICKVDVSKGGRQTIKMKGTICHTTKHFIVVDYGPYKECFLHIDKGDNWNFRKK